jgi:hypothetical protein
MIATSPCLRDPTRFLVLVYTCFGLSTNTPDKQSSQKGWIHDKVFLYLKYNKKR